MSKDETSDNGRVEELRERDERIQNAVMESIRDYIENLPREFVQYDDNGRIVSVHPLRFEGTEFDVRTKRGLFSVSIYPVAFRRIDEQPPRG
jgi:PAS domain-containing protein